MYFITWILLHTNERDLTKLMSEHDEKIEENSISSIDVTNGSVF